MLETLKMFDRNLLLAINGTHSPFLDVVMWQMSLTWPTVLLVVLSAIAIYRRYNLRKGAEFLLGCAIVLACTDLTANLVKHEVKRYRPTHNTEIQKKVRTLKNYYGGQYGFASGHSSNNFGVAAYIFLCFHWMKIRNRVWIFLLPLLIVYSRMYLGVHYPSDIIMGMLIGLFFGWLGFRIINRHFLKFHEAAA
jgi:undecaprenyl-diphosphatase